MVPEPAGLRSPVAKFLTAENVAAIQAETDLREGDVFSVA